MCLVSEDQVGLGQGGAESPHPSQDGPRAQGTTGSRAQLTALFPWATLVLPSWLRQAQSGGTGQRQAASWRTESEWEEEVHRTRACLNNEQLPHLAARPVSCILFSTALQS